MAFVVGLVWFCGGCQTVTTYTSLVDALRHEGATVESAGTVDQPFFAVQGRVITVNGGAVQVFEYPDEVAMESDAGLISDDNFRIRDTQWSWIASPHFFMDGKVMVLYVGYDTEVIYVLTKVLGTQFAGQ